MILQIETDVRADGQTWRRFKRIVFTVFELVSLSVFQSSLLVFVTFWYNAMGDILVWQEAVIFSFTNDSLSFVAKKYM